MRTKGGFPVGVPKLFICRVQIVSWRLVKYVRTVSGYAKGGNANVAMSLEKRGRKPNETWAEVRENVSTFFYFLYKSFLFLYKK